MSSTDAKDLSKEFACPYSAGVEFEQALSRARALFRDGDLEGALELLVHLEKKYVNAAKLFDLLGEVLLRLGNIGEGIRYKTLHEILKGTFRIAAAESTAYGQSAAQKQLAGHPACPVSEAAARAPRTTRLVRKDGILGPEEEVQAGEMDFIPVTAAMGQEFMRQGHFDKAFEIFRLLALKNPEDEALPQARERARKKSREKKVLSVLHRWLENIEQMKAGRSSVV